MNSLPQLPDRRMPLCATSTVSAQLVNALRDDGVQHAFGVMGGALVFIHAALRKSNIALTHCRHESGAAYAALEASLASQRPTVVFATTGPGLTNAITGAVAARQEGAHVLLISGYTAPALHGRFRLQETHAATLFAGLYQPGPVFDLACALTDPAMLGPVVRQLRAGWQRPQGFVAHLAIPLDVQNAIAPVPGPLVSVARPALVPTPQTCRALRAPTVLWVGHGARHASALVRRLAEHLGAPVIATPRAKGVFPETHPQYLGVSGSVGATPDLADRVRASGARQVLILGTRLGEFSASASALDMFDHALHVDLDPHVPGAAWPGLPTQPIIAEIGAWLQGVLDADLPAMAAPSLTHPTHTHWSARASGPVRPQVLMQVLQQRIIDSSTAMLMAESGNAFAWTTRHLRFATPGRYRQSGSFAPMGQISAGAVGAAQAAQRPVVAIVGDGAFLMQNEISTAVETAAHVIWVVLNDARYGMVEQGLAAFGQPTTCQRFPQVDFAALAIALGARGERVESEGLLDAALQRALAHDGPSVVDVTIDADQRAPFGARLESIQTQSTTHGVRQ